MTTHRYCDNLTRRDFTLGIDHRKEYHTNTGRPVMIVREGTVLWQLFA